MGWAIGRAAVLSDPERARRKALEKLQALTELEDPESLVVPILIDAMLLVESYRGARHQITMLPELTNSVDALLREITILEKTAQWAAE
ncbi:MAG TPA: hypothetical protein VFO51_06660 [Sphingomicrobium sp.]|nr:hypothetical protein [Sphingomicrobium sp.]